ANRLVVSTPPQSISRPLRSPASVSRSGAMGNLFGLARELEHSLAELLEVGIVGRAGDRSLVVALHEDHALPQRERGAPAPHAPDSGDLAGFVEPPQPAEAAQLALEVAGGLADPLQAGRPPVDVVDLHQCVDQLLAYLAALLGGV